tara:strand:- start:15176 stop:16162 length:987 start_codon:yes stop_codon:yes gene_type:complete
MSNVKRILITGESGFIGSHLINYFVSKYPDYQIHGLDILTYASDRTHTKILEKNKNYFFHQIDIFNRKEIINLFAQYSFTDVIHLAAESHVDNSINNPLLFANTNIIGTLNILDAFKTYSVGRFHHVSTDEVYGDLNFSDLAFTENSPYNPSSPYSASKAASDHLVRSYHRTYGIDAIITNCSNNYGPHQHIEKFIPTVLASIYNNQKIPIYGSGSNIRDWLYVLDHVLALDLIFHKSSPGKTYNIGADNEISNLNLVEIICDLCLEKKIHPNPRKLISFVSDRLGHDRRYAIESQLLRSELNWMPIYNFNNAISETIDWYIKKFSKI